jgi:hypothetical protein
MRCSSGTFGWAAWISTNCWMPITPILVNDTCSGGPQPWHARVCIAATGGHLALPGRRVILRHRHLHQPQVDRVVRSVYDRGHPLRGRQHQVSTGNEVELRKLEQGFLSISHGAFTGTVAAGDGVMYRIRKPLRAKPIRTCMASLLERVTMRLACKRLWDPMTASAVFCEEDGLNRPHITADNTSVKHCEGPAGEVYAER